ncbi:glycine betaine/proline transport system substrate-binding protein [Salinibacillus kushneri]|uniref:Glycine betaine/proline transport system substrate-binding protein n=1 Tax=Salinibacillus kushneri TaxID=237682 RepID=A0A1I0CGU6_9BACI|nr:glycine betaine ABC transporter substrate-binding protein [Salinibacillus kushneri]SET18744.1 glycine betaine/proline transport system substrate-binding protein [Salinibacillus kushneri]
MFTFKWKRIGLIAGLSLSLIAAGCGQDNTDDTTNDAESGGDGTNVGEEVDYTITGIEPGAGITEATDNALKEYENLAGWEQQNSSTTAMLTALADAIENEEPIVIAGWSPHFKFAKYDLKYLEDPKGVYGDVEYISTIVRKGLKEEKPEAYKILDRFHWETEDMESVMLAAQDMEFEKAAQQWVDENQEKVAEWTKGVEPVDGTSIELVLTPWDTERSSAHVAKIVLEEQGFEVKLTPVDPSIMFQAIAEGDGDASLAPWLPATHGAFYEKFEGEFEDLGENLKGAKIGLVVPTYMDIDSIEDLKPAE